MRTLTLQSIAPYRLTFHNHGKSIRSALFLRPNLPERLWSDGRLYGMILSRIWYSKEEGGHTPLVIHIPCGYSNRTDEAASPGTSIKTTRLRNNIKQRLEVLSRPQTHISTALVEWPLATTLYESRDICRCQPRDF